MNVEISHKKLNGVVYTPQWIVDLILDHLNYEKDIETKKIIDPACGDGAFLEVVVNRFIKNAYEKNLSTIKIKELLEENIYGWDTDKEALTDCKNKLDEIAIQYGIKNIKWKLMPTDSLDKVFAKRYFNFFDFVVGNPPYIRIQNINKEKRENIQKNWTLCSKGSTDIYLAFFELGFYLLNSEGRLGYITPNTYLKTSAGKDLRIFIKNKLKTLINFNHHQIFEDATTYSIITILDKKNNENKFSLYEGNDKKTIKFIDNIEIGNINDNNWILATNKILKRIKEIESRGVPLKEIADIHVGITTLADDYYIFENPIIQTNKAIICVNNEYFEIESKILKPIIKASVLKKYDEDQRRYIIFPYKQINYKNQIIPEEELKREYPLTYQYFKRIKDILLSRDGGTKNTVAWYAFGRSQGLDTSFGKKILTSPMNLKPNFIVWEKPEYTFYSGYCIKYDGDLYELARELNSDDMEFYIKYVSRDYQNNYKSYSKAFIENFGISNPKIIAEYKRKIKQYTLFDF